MVYANICRKCDHPLSRHFLTEDKKGRIGPGRYACQHCDCKVAQDQKSYPLSESDYKRRFDEYERRGWLQGSTHR